MLPEMATRVQISSPGVLSLNSNNNKVIFLTNLNPYHCFEVLKVEGMLSLMMSFSKGVFIVKFRLAGGEVKGLTCRLPSFSSRHYLS